VTEKASATEERVRAAELIAASCLATDLGMGFPFEHGLHATLITMRLVELLDVDPETASQTYYVSLLMYSGCTTDAETSIQIFKGGLTDNVTPLQFGSSIGVLPGLMRAVSSSDSPPLRRVYEIASRLPKAARFRKPHFTAICEVAAMLTERLGLPPVIHNMFAFLTERWDGKGILGRAEGDEIPLPLRIVHVARDAAFQRVVGGDEHAANTTRSRAGHAFDPDIANLFAGEATGILKAADVAESVWDAALDAEPQPRLTLEGQEIDRALAAMGDFADLVSPSLSGHSLGVAGLAAAAAELCGFEPADVKHIRRAGHLHDMGRAAVHPRIWQKPGPLTADEWEHVRLHPYHTERLLTRSPFLASCAKVAAAHHERLDGPDITVERPR
jgi:HD domain